MGAFNINITGVGGHGCERKAKPSDKLYGRCGKFSCPDCAAYDFVQRMKQSGMVRDGDLAYSVELTADDPLAVEYRRAKQAYEQQQFREIPADVVFQPFWKVTTLPVGESSDGKLFRKAMHQALFTHWPDSPTAVVDDMLKNERTSGSF